MTDFRKATKEEDEDEEESPSACGGGQVPKGGRRKHTFPLRQNEEEDWDSEAANDDETADMTYKPTIKATPSKPVRFIIGRGIRIEVRKLYKIHSRMPCG